VNKKQIIRIWNLYKSNFQLKALSLLLLLLSY